MLLPLIREYSGALLSLQLQLHLIHVLLCIIERQTLLLQSTQCCFIAVHFLCISVCLFVACFCFNQIINQSSFGKHYIQGLDLSGGLVKCEEIDLTQNLAT